MYNVLPFVSNFISKYRSSREELIFHPPESITLHDDAKLLPCMPKHTYGPYADFYRDNFTGFEELFPAMEKVGLGRGGLRLVEFTMRDPEDAPNAGIGKSQNESWEMLALFAFIYVQPLPHKMCTSIVLLESSYPPLPKHMPTSFYKTRAQRDSKDHRFSRFL